MTIETIASEIRDEFAFLDDWEMRYAYIIDLGKALPDIDDAYKTDAFRVRGCASQVWFVPRETDDSVRLHFDAQSDALIVSGLIALLTRLFNDQPADDVLSFDTAAFLAEIGVKDALSAQRANGLSAMLTRIRQLASLKTGQETQSS